MLVVRGGMKRYKRLGVECKEIFTKKKEELDYLWTSQVDGFCVP